LASKCLLVSARSSFRPVEADSRRIAFLSVLGGGDLRGHSLQFRSELGAGDELVGGGVDEEAAVLFVPSVVLSLFSGVLSLFSGVLSLFSDGFASFDSPSALLEPDWSFRA
jgi:hypothetical protein